MFQSSRRGWGADYVEQPPVVQQTAPQSVRVASLGASTTMGIKAGLSKAFLRVPDETNRRQGKRCWGRQMSNDTAGVGGWGGVRAAISIST